MNKGVNFSPVIFDGNLLLLTPDIGLLLQIE
jgi:hypothetical protein